MGVKEDIGMNDINGSSEFSTIKPFAFWTQHVLPLVYGDEISYMETLNKVVKLLNELIKNNNQLPEYIEEIVKEYITSGELEKVVRDVVSNFILNVKYPPDGITPAVGDGTANDYEALQGCIDYAYGKGGGVVYIPFGDYLTSKLTLKEGVSLLGFSKYCTNIILTGGESGSLLSGSITDCGVIGLTLNANMGIQVNNVDVVSLTGNNFQVNDCILTNGYTLLNIEKTGNYIGINNVKFDYAVESHLRVGGSTGVINGRDLFFGTLSTIKGIAAIISDSNDDVFMDVTCNAPLPLFAQFDGSNNVITGVVKTNNAIAGNASNIYEFYGKSKNVNYSGDVTESVGGSKTESVTGDDTFGANNYTVNVNSNAVINSKEIVLNPETGITYKTPTTINDYFKAIPFKDNNEIYNVLVLGDKTTQLEIASLKTVVDYGADPTGVSDSTNAFNMSLSQVGYAVVPTGTFLVRNVALVSNTAVVGMGGTITTDVTGLDQGWFKNSSSGFVENVVFKNIIFTCKTPSFTESVRGIYLNRIKNVVIENCSFIGWNGDAILIDNYSGLDNAPDVTYNIYINNCQFRGHGESRQAISIVDGHDITITNCYFNNTSKINMPGAIDIEPWNAFKHYMYNIYICGNYITNNLRPLVNIYLDKNFWNEKLKNVTITNNVVNNYDVPGAIFNGLLFYNTLNYAYDEIPISEITVCFNSVKAKDYCLMLDAAKGVRVNNNNFESCSANLSSVLFYNAIGNPMLSFDDNVFNLYDISSQTSAVILKVNVNDIVSFTGNTFNVFNNHWTGGVLLDKLAGDNINKVKVFNCNMLFNATGTPFGYLVGVIANTYYMEKHNAVSDGLNIVSETPTAFTFDVITPAVNVAKGDSFTFAVAYTGIGGVATTWAITGQSSTGTTISTGGTLTIASDEASKVVNVSATASGSNKLVSYACVNVM